MLLKREYIVRNGKSLEATDKGIRLIEVVHPEVKSPIMTGQWEAYLHRIQRGTAQLVPFVKGIEDYVREVVGKVGQVPVQADPRPRRSDPQPSHQRHARRTEPRTAAPVLETADPSRDRHGSVAVTASDPLHGGRSPNSCKPPSASPPSAQARKPSARP